MVICFNATAEAKQAIDQLVATGQFKDSSEAISLALINYQLIQSAVDSTGILTLSPQAGRVPPNTTSGEQSPGAEPSMLIPPLFAANPELAPSTIPPHPFSVSTGTVISPKEWLFGQYNRFLPVKATCRALLNLTGSSADDMSVDEVALQISQSAALLGDILVSMDTASERRREEAFSSAFPTTSIRGDQSRLRFCTQFVGVIRQGVLQGMPAALGLISSELGRNPNLSLTDAGLAFAQISNPILDSTVGPVARPLSEEERAFLLNHISSFVPQEKGAYDAILDGISEGAATPDKLDQYLRDRFDLKTEGDISTTFIATQRTGAISRMVELDLIAREKSGLHVTYVTTSAGKQLQR